MIEVDIHPEANRAEVLNELRGFGIVYERVVIRDRVGVACHATEIPAIKLIPGVVNAVDGNEPAIKPAGSFQTFNFDPLDQYNYFKVNRTNLAILGLDHLIPSGNDIALAQRVLEIHRENDGEGVEIAVTDTKIEDDGVTFAGRFNGTIYDGYPSDEYHPHGIMCGSIAAGSQFGIAPGADVVNARLFNDSNSGTSTILTNAWDAVGARHLAGSVNTVLSYSGSSTSGTDPHAAIVNSIVALGVPFIAAAGNDGNDLTTTDDSWPAENTKVLGIGGLDPQGRVDPESNYGHGIIRLYGDYRWHWTLAYARHSIEGRGTSFACPQASGVAALALQGRAKMTTEAEVLAFYAEMRQYAKYTYTDVNNRPIGKLYYPVKAIPVWRDPTPEESDPNLKRPKCFGGKLGWYARTSDTQACLFEPSGMLKDENPYTWIDTDRDQLAAWEDYSGRYAIARNNLGLGPSCFYDKSKGGVYLDGRTGGGLLGYMPQIINIEEVTMGMRFMADAEQVAQFQVLLGSQTSGGTDRFWIALNNGQCCYGLGSMPGGTYFAGADTRGDDTWHTIFMTCDGTTVKLYLDGVEIRSDVYTGGGIPNNYRSSIGARNLSGSSRDLMFRGWVSHVMQVPYSIGPDGVAEMQARWTSQALPDVADLSPAVAHSAVGKTDGAISALDTGTGPWTVTGGVLYASGQMDFPGSSDIITIPNSNAAAIRSGDFHLEVVYTPRLLGGNMQGIIGQWSTTDRSWLIRQDNANQIDFFFTDVGGTSKQIMIGDAPTLNVETKIEVIRRGDDFILIQDGRVTANGTASYDAFDSSEPLTLGTYDLGTRDLNGLIKSFSITPL